MSPLAVCVCACVWPGVGKEPVLCLARLRVPPSSACLASVKDSGSAVAVPGLELYDVASELTRGLYAAGPGVDLTSRVGHVR